MAKGHDKVAALLEESAEEYADACYQLFEASTFGDLESARDALALGADAHCMNEGASLVRLFAYCSVMMLCFSAVYGG